MDKKSYVRNCEIITRNDEPLFYLSMDDGSGRVWLDGYRIEPVEDAHAREERLALLERRFAELDQ